MPFFVQHQGINEPAETEAYDTEAAADRRADWLVKAKNMSRVVVYEVEITEDVA